MSGLSSFELPSSPSGDTDHGLRVVELHQPSAVEDCFEFSHRFWALHQDVLPKGFGVVLSAAITSEDKLFDLNWVRKQRYEGPTEPLDDIMLKFDATWADKGMYGWQLTRSNMAGGVVTNMLAVPRELLVCEYDINCQGMVRNYRGVKETEAYRLLGFVQRLSQHWLVEHEVAQTRRQQEIARDGLSDFEAISKSPSNIAKRRKIVDQIGLLPLAPMELRIPGVDPWFTSFPKS